MALCTHFTQNAWRKDLCANCFKSRGEHGGGGGGAAGAGGAPRYLSSVCASRWRSLADAPLQAKAPLQGILRARAAATSALPTHASSTSAAPRRRAANGTAGNSVRFSADQPQVIGEGGGDWPSDDEHNEEENGVWSNGQSDDGSSGSSSSGDDDAEEEDEEARALQRLTRNNTHLNAAPPEKESVATTNGIAEGASPRRPLALGRPLTGADGQRRAPLLVAVTPFGTEERSGSRIPVAARSRANGAGAAAAGAATATGASPAREKRRKEEENERQLRRKNSAEVNIEHVTTSESTTDDSLNSAIPPPKGVTKASSNGPTTNGPNTPSITNSLNTHTPITNGLNTHTPITNGLNTHTPITNGPNTHTPIINGSSTKSSITDCSSANNSFIKGSTTNTPITDCPNTNTSTTNDLIKGTPPVVTNVKNSINAPRQVVGEDAPTAVGVSKQQQLAALAVEDVKRPEQLLGTPATAAPTEIITARAEPALAKMTGDLTPPLKDVDKDAVDGGNAGNGDLARPDPDGRADPEGGPSEPPSTPAPAIITATPVPTPTAPPASGPPPGIDPRPSFLHSRLPRGAASGSAGTPPSPATANGKPVVPAKPEVRLGPAPGQSSIAARQASELARSSAAIAVASSSDGKEKYKEKPSMVASISSHWSGSSFSPAAPAATPTACIPVLIPTVPICSANAATAAAAAAAEGVARTPKRPAPRPPPPCAASTPAAVSEVDEGAVYLLEEKKEDEERQVMKEGNKEDVEKANGEEKRTEERTVERPTTLNIVPQPVLQPQQLQPHPIQEPPPSPPSPPPPLVPIQQHSTPASLSISTPPSMTPAPTTPGSIIPATPDHRPQKAPKPKFSLRKLLRFGGRGSGAGAAGGGRGLTEGNGGTEGQGHGTGGGTGPHATSPTRTRPEIVHPLELRGSPERVDTPPRRSPQEPLYVNGGLVNAYNAGRPAQPPPPPRAPASSPPSSIASTPTTNASCLQTPPPVSGGARPIRPPPPRTNSLPGAATGPRQPPPRTCGMMAVTAVGPDYAGSGTAAADGLYANLGEARSALAPHKPQRSGSLREAPGGCSTGSADSDPGYEQVLNGPPRPVSDSGDSTNEPVYERVRAHPVPAAYMNGGGGRVFSRSASLPACCGPLVDALQGLDPDAAFYASCSQPHSVGSSGGVGTRGGRLASRPALHRSLEDAYGAVVGANHEALAHALERVTLSLSAAPPSLSPAVLRALRSAADSGALRFGHFRPTLQSTWHATDAGGRRWTRAVWDAQGGASPPCEVMLCVGAPGRGGLRAPALGARGLAHAALASLAEFAATPEELPSVLRPSSPVVSSSASDSQHTTQPNRTDTVWVSVLGPARVQSLQDYGQALQGTAGPAGRRAAALALLQLVNALKALQARGQEEAVVSGFVVMLPPDDVSGSLQPPPSQTVSSLCPEGVQSQGGGGGGAAVAAVGSEIGARVVALPEAALVGGVAGAATQSLCACVDAGLRALLPPSAPLSAPLHALLQQERADSLSRAQAALEFTLWGPAPSPAAADEEEALQRWLDLERASELRALVDALTATTATAAAAAAGDGSQGHATGAVATAGGGSVAATGMTGGPRAASVAERCRLWFLVRTSARALVDAARLLRREQALEASES